MKETNPPEETSPKKKKPESVYDLELLKKDKRVPVDIVELDERSLTGNYCYKSTGTLLEPINLKTSTKDVSILDIGWDTEYVDPRRLRTEDGKLVSVVGEVPYNYLISTQFYVHYREAVISEILKDSEAGMAHYSEPVSWEGCLIHNPFRWHKSSINADETKGNRLNYSDFIHIVLQRGIQLGKLKCLPKDIHMFAHFNIVEMDKWKDLHDPKKEGDKPLWKWLSTIRKSYSTRGGFKVASNGNAEDSQITKVRIGDTINLCPAGKSLKDIGLMLSDESPQLTVEKVDVGTVILDGISKPAIENMGELAYQDFARFYKYAMQDARIPLFYIDKVRDIQREMFLKPYPANTSVYNESEEERKEKWTKVLTSYFSQQNLKATLTAIGADYLKDVVWNNHGYKFYSREEVIENQKFYNPRFDATNKFSPALNWKDLLGIKPKKTLRSGKKTTPQGKEVLTDPKPVEEDRYFDGLKTYIPLMRDCYYGGRNEQYFYGITPPDVGTVYDYDLVSAYPSAMLCVGRVDWRKPINIIGKNGFEWEIIRDWKNYVCYCSIESFEFPEDVLYPTIPVKNNAGNGIIFPRKGSPSELLDRDCATRITGVEIDTAMRLGCKIVIQDGIAFKMDNSFCPWEAFIVNTIKERRAAEKDGNLLMKQFWKEMMNSVYGKTAQGISDKATYDIESGKSQKLGQSKITSYPLVGIVTAHVRAVLGILMNEINSKFPGTFIGNITTDGFATNFPSDDDSWKQITQSPLVQNWLKARSRMEGYPMDRILNIEEDKAKGIEEKKFMIETKHKVERYVGWRTRGQATLYMELTTPDKYRIVESDHLDKDEELDKSIGFPAMPEEKHIMHAKAGQRTPLADKGNAAVESVWWFLNRFPGLKYSLTYLSGVRSHAEKGMDTVNINTLRQVSMDFDLKRMPILNSMSTQEVEYLDVLDTMEFKFALDPKRANERFTYMTAEFANMNDFTPDDWKSRRCKAKSLTFFTKPIESLDQFELIRAYWLRHRKNNYLENEEIKDSEVEEIDEHLSIDRQEWNLLKERCLGGSTPLRKVNGVEVFKATVKRYRNGEYQSIATKDCIFSQYRPRLVQHLNNAAIMNSETKLKKFLHFYQTSVLSNEKGSKFYASHKGGTTNVFAKHMNALCLARCLGVHGLDDSVGETFPDGTFMQWEPRHFYVHVYDLFLGRDEAKRHFKLINDSDSNYEAVVKHKIGNKIDKTASEFRNILGVAEKYTADEFETDSDIILVHLNELKNTIAPNLNIEPFIGKVDFYKDLPCIKPNRRPKLTAQQRKVNQAVKGAMKSLEEQTKQRKRMAAEEVARNPEIADLLIKEWEDDTEYPIE